MALRRWIGPSLILGLVFMTGAGRGQDKLEWKSLKKDTSFFQTVETKTEQELKVSDMTFKQKQNQTFLMEWTPKGEKDGKLTIEQKIIGVKMDLDIGGNKISYKPDDESKNPMTQFFKTLEQAKFTLTVNTKTHKVEKVEGLDDLVKKLSAVNKSFEPVLKQILSEETIKTLAEPVFGVLPPDGTIPKDKTWESAKTTLKMGPLGSYTTVIKYTDEGADKNNAKVQKIKVEPELTYQKPEDTKDNKGALPFTITKGTLTTQKAKGTVYFDKDKGRVEKSDLHVELKGDLTVSIAQTENHVDLNQTQDVTVQTYDSNPWAKEKKK